MNNVPISQPETRRTELLRTLGELSPDPDETLHTLVDSSRSLEELIGTLREINEMEIYPRRYPLQESALLKHMIAIGVRRPALLKMFLPQTREEIEFMRALAAEVAKDIGGLPALVTLLEPRPERRDAIYALLLPQDSDGYYAVMQGLSRVDAKKLPKLRNDRGEDIQLDTIPAWRASVAAVLQGTHPNEITRQPEEEQGLQDSETDNKLFVESCYVSIEPKGDALMAKLVFPWGADVFRIPRKDAERYEKWLALDTGVSLKEIAAGESRFTGTGTMKMMHPEQSGRATYPRLFWQCAVR